MQESLQKFIDAGKEYNKHMSVTMELAGISKLLEVQLEGEYKVNADRCTFQSRKKAAANL